MSASAKDAGRKPLIDFTAHATQ
uniref:Hypothethical protein n=1 Tax=Ralstonia solanacearum TaxID=305 RepID=A0A0S4VDE3_RALSL|nr:Hypothethical protein [Ralstonia solanacearum]CUV32656.1 Hypothethical protein [Ralstonia solanacearum]CUV41824.1 Hypothethical protein [Ralstonia solanacearum]CUV62696.1 Hypothethical protein [Ralstonia solanacearum]